MEREANEANPSPDGAGSVDDSAQLDSLLQEFDTPAETTPQPQPEENDMKAVRQLLEQQQRDQAAEKTAQGMNESIAMMREVVGDGIGDGLLKTYLIQEAESDTRIASAFQYRYDNPDKWKGVVTNIAKKMKGEFGNNDPQIEESLEAVRASTSTSTETGPDDQYSMANLNKLSDFELQQTMKEYAKNLR